MTRFIDMLESARKAENNFDEAGVCRAMKEVEKRCRSRGRLSAEAVWRLHRKEALELERETGFRPAGGWRLFCSLLVGTGILRAEDDCFVVGPTPIGDWIDDETQVRVRMMESFTRWLIPPSVAAGLFLAMGVHPLWGLRLARKLHVDGPMMEASMVGWRDEELLPDEDLAQLRKGIFCSLSVLLSGLRRLRKDRRYGLEGLGGFISEAIVFGREQIEESGQGLEVLIEDLGDPKGAVGRSMEFATRELIDGVLVPAGVMRRYDDDTFAVDSNVLGEVRVGHLGQDAQRTWFQCFLVDEPGILVA